MFLEERFVEVSDFQLIQEAPTNISWLEYTTFDKGFVEMWQVLEQGLKVSLAHVWKDSW